MQSLNAANRDDYAAIIPCLWEFTYSADTGVHLQIDARCLIREHSKKLRLCANVFTHAIVDVEDVRSRRKHHPKVAVLIGGKARDFLFPILCQNYEEVIFVGLGGNARQSCVVGLHWRQRKDAEMALQNSVRGRALRGSASRRKQYHARKNKLPEKHTSSDAEKGGIDFPIPPDMQANAGEISPSGTAVASYGRFNTQELRPCVAA